MTTSPGRLDIGQRLSGLFRSVGARGFVHLREVDGTHEVGVDADEPVVLASVFKVPLALAYAREVAAGRLDERERVPVPAELREGGIGTAGCADDVVMSWRDLARFMLTMSDNAATDLILRRVGVEAVHAVLAELGLHRTRLIGGCAEIYASMTAELGYGSTAALEENLTTMEPARLSSISALDPARTTAGTPRETTALLAAIWLDLAGPAQACAQVRSLMAQQIWPHRLASGFPDEVRIAAKTGTLPGVRNEVGVVVGPDGRAFAVAVFTRSDTMSGRAPAIDAAIGTAARIGVDHLRASTRPPELR